MNGGREGGSRGEIILISEPPNFFSWDCFIIIIIYLFATW